MLPIDLAPPSEPEPNSDSHLRAPLLPTIPAAVRPTCSRWGNRTGTCTRTSHPSRPGRDSYPPSQVTFELTSFRRQGWKSHAETEMRPGYLGLSMDDWRSDPQVDANLGEALDLLPDPSPTVR